MTPRQPDYDREGITLYCGDCLDILPTLEAGSVDAVVTDPPYGYSFAARPTKWQRRAGMRPEQWDDETTDVSGLLGISTTIVVWGGNYFVLPPSRGWLAWHKPDAPPSMSNVELAWTSLDQNARHIIHSIAATNAERVGHPTQKPLAVMLWTLEQVGIGKTDTILDPFMGSGTTAVACIRTGRKCIGIEKEPRYFDIAVKRVEEEFARTALFDGNWKEPV